MRQITKKTFLYTEMIPADAICFGKKDKILGFHPEEHPISIQLGGSTIKYLKEASVIAEQYGYDEINLNVGCPSDRVQEGKFGACLMQDPPLVADLIREMQSSVKIPVTIKHRIGVDDVEDYDSLVKFVETIAATGCKRFSIHARKAILKGLSPKENRNIPPLKYDFVYQLKKDFPHLIIEINGGIKTITEAQSHLNHVDGVMIGRAAWDNPFIFSEVDGPIFNDSNATIPLRVNIINTYANYMEGKLSDGEPMSLLLLPVFNLFNGLPGASHWRRYLSENGHRKNASPSVLIDAVNAIAQHSKLFVS
jgi:tRNA-dihydrouridine synthase A